MKRLLSFIAFMAVVRSLFAYAFSDVAPNGQTLYYNYQNGSYTNVIVVGGSSLTGNLIIPSSAWSYSYRTVVGIDASAFSGCTGLTSVTIPSSVTSIGNSAFSGCTGLTSVTIPSSVTSIGSYAFSGCTGLTSMTIPSSVTSIGNGLFYNCTGLTSVTIPSSVTSIGSGSFYNCTGLTSVTIPNSVTSIGNEAFSSCTGLASVTIPNSVTSIEYRAFYNCTGLTSVNYNAICCISAGVTPTSPAFAGCTNISTFNFGSSVTRIPSCLCSGLSGLTSVSMPASLTIIGDYAFYGCSGLTSVTIPNAVDSIGLSAFYGCTGLTTINFNADSCTYVGKITYLGYGDAYAYYAFKGCNNVTTVNFGNNVVLIPPYLCYELGLISVTIPNSVTRIENAAFYGCSGLSSLVIPNSVTNIGARAFSGCTGLLSVSLPNSLTTIGNAAFYNCTGLTSLTIPTSVISIGDSGFSGCTGIRLLEFNADSCIYMGSFSGSSYNYARAIFNNTDIRTINIGSNVKNIPAYTFYRCNHITSITIPELVSNIGVQAFDLCTNLDTVNLYPIVPPLVGSNTFPSGVYCYNVRCDAYNTYYNAVQWLTYRSSLRSWLYPNIAVNVSSSNPAHGTATRVLQSGHEVSCDSLCIIWATSNFGYRFDHWSNGRTMNPDTLHLIGDSTVVAYFAKNQFGVVGVSSNPDRGYVLGSDTVDYLDTVVLTAVANHGYTFDHWSDGAYENPHSVIASGNRTFTAYFTPTQFSLTVLSSDENKGTVSGGGDFGYQSNRTIRATPNNGYHFSYWNDGDTNSIRTITLMQDTTFIAYFAPNQYTLTLQSADDTRGSVSGGGTYYYHDTVTISAVAVEHYHFAYWSDNDSGNPRQYVIEGNKTLIAYFALDVHNVVVQVDNPAHGTVSGGGPYSYGSPATITAETPFSGWVFSHWSDGARYNPYTFAVLQDTVMTAYFVPEGSQNGVGGIDATAAHIYVINEQIVIEGAEGKVVTVYDVYGRILTTKWDKGGMLRFNVPAAGVYLVRVGDAPARRVVVVQ